MRGRANHLFPRGIWREGQGYPRASCPSFWLNRGFCGFCRMTPHSGNLGQRPRHHGRTLSRTTPSTKSLRKSDEPHTRSPQDAPPAVSFKLDLPQENALKSHIYRLMSCPTRIIPLLLSSGTTLLNTITHAAVAVPGEPASRRAHE